MAEAKTRSSLGDIGCAPCREATLKEMLTRRADELRAEAIRLETLAMELPQGYLSPVSEGALRNLIFSGLQR